MAQVSSTFLSRPREPGNKGVARQLRRSGWIPAVAYGPSSETRHLAVDPKTFLMAQREYGAARIYDVEVEGTGIFKALIKQVDRDPVSRELLHIDLFAVDMNKPIKVNVKVALVGKPAGILNGGMLQQILREVEVQCLPGKIPAIVEVDVAHMDLGDTLHMSEIPLPDGVRITAASDETIAIIAAPEVEEEAKPAEEEAAVEGEAEEGAKKDAAPAEESKEKKA